MFKSANFFIVLGILFVAVLVGSYYFSAKNAANQEPIKIYKATPWPQEKVVPSELPALSHPSEEQLVPNSAVSTPSEAVHEQATHE